MDRRNGGNPLAPPRPPKSLPRVHRPRAPEPDTVDSPFVHIISTHPPPIPVHQPISKMSGNLNNTNNISSSINSSSLGSVTTSNSHRSIPPATAPLTPLQNNRIISNNHSATTASAISTFSRIRTEMPVQRVAAPNPVQSGPRSVTPSSVVAPTANFISNAISTVVGRSPSPVNNSVTLQIPRPENERLPNEYVDTPFTNQNNSKLTTPGSRHSLATSTVPNRNQLNSHTTNISTIDGISVLNHNINNINNKVSLPNRTSTAQRPNLLPITKQPSFRSNNTLSKKDAALHQQFSHCPEDSILSSQNVANGLNISSASEQLNSITCPQCNRCRCEKCQRPRPLPTKWICDDNCYCSAETIIDYASCLCCVKALFYHCSKDHDLDCESETFRCAEDPCSCVPYKRASRWGCLSVLSILLPCLCCYWPMRGCVSLCAKCYAKHSRHGCRCNISSSSTNHSFNSRQTIINLASPTSQDQPPTHHHHRRDNIDLTPEKRLLDSSNSEY